MPSPYWISLSTHLTIYHATPQRLNALCSTSARRFRRSSPSNLPRSMEAALGVLCRGGGWSYAVVWRSHPQDPRLLTLGEYYCEDEARKVGEDMHNQVHIVGEGIIGEAMVSGKCQWIFDDTFLGLDQLSHADNQDLFQGYTWLQHQSLNGIKTIAVVPLQLQGVVQFGSMQKVFKNSVFFNQVNNMLDQMSSTSNDPSTIYTQTDALAYTEQSILGSMRSMNGILVHNKVTPLKSEKFEENTERIESLRSSICFSSNSQRSLNDLTSYGSGGTSLNPYMVAMPVNSKSINEFKGFDKFSNFHYQNIGARTPLQVKSSKEPDSSFARVISAYKRLDNLQRTEVSSDQNMPEYFPYLYTCSNSPNSGIGFSSSCTTVSGKSKDCLQTESEKLLCKSISLSRAPSVSQIQDNCFTPHHALVHEQSLVPDPGEGPSVLLHEESVIVQSDLLQVKDTNHLTSEAYCTDPELPNRTFEEATVGTTDCNMKGINENSDLLESMMFDLSANSLVRDWSDDNVLLAGNLPNLGDTASESVTELTNNHPLSIGARRLTSISALEQFLGANDNVSGDVHVAAACSPSAAEASALAGCVSDYQLPSLDFQDCLTAYNAQVPPLVFPSSSYTSENAQNGSSKATSVSLANISVDDSCSFNTGNSKNNQPNNPEGMKIAKKRARPGESTRPRPKDRQQIQDRVKELREIVPNGAKCSIDALLDRTIKHMLFLQSVTKYAEKIKQSDEPKMIGKESGLVLKDEPSTGKDGGATWAYEVAGQTMVCPIIIEDLAPPGQMLIEMLCEERGFFLEIADNIRGFGLTILKGLMELRDSKIWARFLVEASRDVTRMDIFLSLVQLLQQNSLARSTDQMTKVTNNGPPSFADYQRSPLPIPVGIAERL